MLAAPAFAADPPPSTDDQLRDSLNSKTDDDYDRALLGDPAKPDDKGRVDEEMQKKLQKELGAAAQKEGKAENPLLQVAKEMREVQQRIGRRDSGQDTQHVQRQIVADLAKLIEQAKKSGSGDGKPSKGRKTAGSPKKPGQDSTQASGNSPAPAERSDPTSASPRTIRDAAKNEAHQRMLDSIRIEIADAPTRADVRGARRVFPAGIRVGDRRLFPPLVGRSAQRGETMMPIWSAVIHYRFGLPRSGFSSLWSAGAAPCSQGRYRFMGGEADEM